MKKLFLSILLITSLTLSGCAGLSFDINNQTQQLMVKTTIQLATATYLDKNSSTESISLVITITDDIMNYLTSDAVYNNTMIGIQKKLHVYIAQQDLAIAQKIALTSLSDVIIAQAVSWAKISLDTKLTEGHSNVLFFCANTMNETAKLFIIPDRVGRSYSVTRKYED